MCFRVSVVGAEPVRGLEIHVTSSWLTNRAGGGDPLASGYKIEDAPEDAVCLAARAAAAIDADCSGVDVMEKADGALYVLETDAFAGLGRTAVCRYVGRYVLELSRRKENRARSDAQVSAFMAFGHGKCCRTG